MQRSNRERHDRAEEEARGEEEEALREDRGGMPVGPELLGEAWVSVSNMDYGY